MVKTKEEVDEEAEAKNNEPAKEDEAWLIRFMPYIYPLNKRSRLEDN